MRNSLIILAILFGLSLHGQTKRDPRVVGMAGSYTTIADGIFSIGYNPGLIGFQQNKPFMMQIGQLDIGLLGNFFSIQNVADFSGDTLDAKEKDELFDQLEAADGMSFFMDTHMPIPILNISKGNLAFTTNNIILQNYRLPMGLLELVFYGNAEKPDLDLELNYEILGLNEFGFSFGMPFGGMSWGVTLKYLQGLFYLGIDEDSSSANLITDDLGIYGSGKYVIRQGVGGSGYGLDIGVVSKPINGWTFGASMINILGTITWNKGGSANESNSFNPLSSYFYPFDFGGDLGELQSDESVLFTYNIDTVRAVGLSTDSLFTNDIKFFVDTLKNGKRPEFITRYPSTFRLGTSKQFNDFLFASDLVAGFENKYYARSTWRWSIATEWTRIEAVPMRIGYAWSGGDLQELAFGFGIHKGPIIFDLGFAFRNGLWLHTMKGFNFSTGITITSFKSRKSKNIKEGPSENPRVKKRLK